MGDCMGKPLGNACAWLTPSRSCACSFSRPSSSASCSSCSSIPTLRSSSITHRHTIVHLTWRSSTRPFGSLWCSRCRSCSPTRSCTSFFLLLTLPLTSMQHHARTDICTKPSEFPLGLGGLCGRHVHQCAQPDRHSFSSRHHLGHRSHLDLHQCLERVPQTAACVCAFATLVLLRR